VTIIQKPNTLLIVTLAGYLLESISGGILRVLASIIIIIAGSIWSYLEITKGVNIFRKLLGIFVLLLIFWNLLMQLK
jgi:hypothetical protein